MLRLGQERDELSVVSDQIGSPTYATDLANAILDIVQNKTFKEAGQDTQVYHYSNEGEISWYEFAKEIFELVDIQCSVSPITTEQYPTPAKRPKNTLMDKSRIIRTFNVNVIFWKDSLAKCLPLYK
jgi:dTDP-4-dehydrorhamnose reductase